MKVIDTYNAIVGAAVAVSLENIGFCLLFSWRSMLRTGSQVG